MRSRKKTFPALKKVTENSRLLEVNINKAYLDLNRLIKESRKLKDSLSEMTLMERNAGIFIAKTRSTALSSHQNSCRKFPAIIVTNIIKPWPMYTLQKPIP
ncbi:hypothetical protein [uncultured Chryseobacterium sp.]|uniref:hypothetical protein n=1 Tax=uncultured Chryseobacterium sp. TaxID=259322 RepID=UPI0025EA5BA9|nr:hypothetical protein [uncultured Chryseobacterium sp.]